MKCKTTGLMIPFKTFPFFYKKNLNLIETSQNPSNQQIEDETEFGSCLAVIARHTGLLNLTEASSTQNPVS
jgi:hypothetical protein